uniref:RNA dependent RNA polymerase n=1 Tax=Erysiphe necator associated ourmia-like virus 6 TaxID=2689564 RepID=A0A6B9KHD3_9VIRU|nr:RNA dependent RNA polymerase [Erysiphe necator associated ourmia-like virus 6]
MTSKRQVLPAASVAGGPTTRKTNTSTFSRRSQGPRGVGEVRLEPASRVLSDVSQVLGEVLSTSLEVPDIFENSPAGVKRVKEFCVGLLENPISHTWWPAVKKLGHRERITVAGSLFLCRKALPSPPDPSQAEKHRALMTTPAPSPPPAFLEHIDRKIDELFDRGWDRGYKGQVYSHTPTSSSCLQYGRRSGGARRFLSEQGRDWFTDRCLGESEDLPLVVPTRYSVVRTAGKNRGVTVPDGYAHVLGPLHRTLYDYLSQFEWLLRGEARGRKFKGFRRKRGEVFVSGDYESATDNLSLEVTERILLRILGRTRNVPESVKQYAMRSLRARICYPGGRVVDQQRGQLMGSYLSFPLLCLQNYLAFTFAIPRSVPVRINGDDIVFRCRPAEYEHWRKMVGAAGLVLSEGKTMVNRSIFSLNSAFFDACSRRVREIPVIRGGSLILNRESVPSGGGFSRFIRGWKCDARRRVGALWLRSFRTTIYATGRSVEALGIPADNSQLHTAGLAVREAFFRGPREELRLEELPMPRVASEIRDQHGDEWICTPEVIRSTAAEEQRWSRLWKEVASALPWNGIVCKPPDIDELWGRIKAGSREQQWRAWRSTVKRAARLLGGKPLNSILRVPKRGCRKVPRWVPAYEFSARRLTLPGIGLR